jgi:methylenetetrahydrofolate dehydrogenase (NADP+) / methenyltetrahydrofolate cyclohydrolase
MMRSPARRAMSLRETQAHVIDGEGFARELRADVEVHMKELLDAGVRPGLATVLVGEDYAAQAYERRVRRLAEDLGCHYVAEDLAPDIEQADALAVVGKLNADPRVSGILILRPLPQQVAEAEIYRTLDPLKDIEAVHPENAGLLALGEPRFTPSTPASVFYMLDRYVEESGRDPKTFYNGLDLVLVGRSNNVGKPAAILGLQRNATVISAHKHTADAGRLEQHTRQADLLIVAAGVSHLIKGDMVKEGAIVVDIGINATEGPDGNVVLTGDVDTESVEPVAGAVSPVPGGVGPITDVWVLRNTVHAARINEPRSA